GESWRVDHRRRRTIHPQGSAGNRTSVLRKQQARVDLSDVERANSAAHHSGCIANSGRMPEPQRNCCSRYRRAKGRSRRDSSEIRKLGYRHSYRANTESNKKTKAEGRSPTLDVFHEQKSRPDIQVS